METIKADNTKTEFVIISSRTADDVEAKHPNTARIMREHGTVRLITGKRPNGKKYYELVQYANGSIQQIGNGW